MGGEREVSATVLGPPGLVLCFSLLLSLSHRFSVSPFLRFSLLLSAFSFSLFLPRPGTPAPDIAAEAKVRREMLDGRSWSDAIVLLRERDPVYAAKVRTRHVLDKMHITDDSSCSVASGGGARACRGGGGGGGEALRPTSSYRSTTSYGEKARRRPSRSRSRRD